MSRTVFSHQSAITAPFPIEVHGLEESHLDRNKQFFTLPAKEYKLQETGINFLGCYFILWLHIHFTKIES